MVSLKETGSAEVEGRQEWQRKTRRCKLAGRKERERSMEGSQKGTGRRGRIENKMKRKEEENKN